MKVALEPVWTSPGLFGQLSRLPGKVEAGLGQDDIAALIRPFEDPGPDLQLMRAGPDAGKETYFAAREEMDLG
jgi:hypothetical protein